MNNKTLQLAFLFLSLAGIAVLTFVVLSPFLTVLVVAAMAAVVTQPFNTWLAKRMGGRRAISSLLTVIAFVALILTPVSFIATQVFSEAVDVYADVTANRSDYLHTIEGVVREPLQRFLPNFELESERYVQRGLEIVTSNLGRVLSGTVEVLVDLFLFLIAFYYFLKDGPRFSHKLMALSPLSDRYDQEVFDRMVVAIDSMVRGQLFVAVIQGFLTGIGFAFFGVPSPALWGSLAALCALIPGIGTSIVIIPAIIYLFATGHTWQGGGLILWGGVAVGLIDNLLGPTLIGRGAKIHPLFVLFAVLGGIAFYGPMGFLLGPLTLSLLFALLDIYRLLVLKEQPILTAGK